MKKVLSVFLILILLISVISCSSNEEKKEEKKEEQKKEQKEEKKEEQKEEQKEETKKEESKTPEVKGMGLVFESLDGQKVKLSDLKGKKVYMEFMATW